MPPMLPNLKSYSKHLKPLCLFLCLFSWVEKEETHSRYIETTEASDVFTGKDLNLTNTSAHKHHNLSLS